MEVPRHVLLSLCLFVLSCFRTDAHGGPVGVSKTEPEVGNM